MTIVGGRQIVLAARPKGKPHVTEFRLEETTIPAHCVDGGFAQVESPTTTILVTSAGGAL